MADETDKAGVQKPIVPASKTRTITVDGIRLTVNPDVFNDFQVLSWLYDIQHTDTGDGFLSFVPLVKRICGRQFDTVLNHFKRDGRVRVDDIAGFIAKVLEKVAPNS